MWLKRTETFLLNAPGDDERDGLLLCLLSCRCSADPLLVSNDPKDPLLVLRMLTPGDGGGLVATPELSVFKLTSRPTAERGRPSGPTASEAGGALDGSGDALSAARIESSRRVDIGRGGLCNRHRFTPKQLVSFSR